MLGEYPPLLGEIYDRPIFFTHVDVPLSPDYLAEETLCPPYDS